MNREEERVPDTLISQRKSEHLRIVAEQDVSHRGTTLLEDVRLLHDALPERDLSEIALETEFFGRTLAAPLMITSMTGGADFAERLNHGLAAVAQDRGIAFAVGSQRVMLRHPEVAEHFRVRSEILDGVLLGNIGAVQLVEYPVERIAGLAREIEADGMCVHLNAGQELMQVEGNRNFRGLLDGIARLNDELEGRVLVKETGAGLSPGALERLRSIGVRFVDVAGAGGTSWTRVESRRQSNAALAATGETFGDWGVPTAASVAWARKALPGDATVIASGGIRHGLDAARALALGADIAGFARAVLVEFLEGGGEKAAQWIDRTAGEIRTAILLTGGEKPTDLRRAPRVITGRLREWLQATNGPDEVTS